MVEENSIRPPLSLLDDKAVMTYNYDVSAGRLEFYSQLSVLVTDAKRLERNPEDYVIRIFVGNQGTDSITNNKMERYHGVFFIKYSDILLSNENYPMYPTLCVKSCSCDGEADGVQISFVDTGDSDIDSKKEKIMREDLLSVLAGHREVMPIMTQRTQVLPVYKE